MHNNEFKYSLSELSLYISCELLASITKILFCLGTSQPTTDECGVIGMAAATDEQLLTGASIDMEDDGIPE